MKRISVPDEVAEQLESIKGSNWTLRNDRGLDRTVAHVVDRYKTNEAIMHEIRMLESHITKIIENKVEEGVKKALQKWIQNLLSFAEP